MNAKSFERLLLDFMAAPAYRPLTQHELADALHVRDRERPEFRHALRALERAGRAVVLRKNRWALPAPRAGRFTGPLRIHPHGFGFVIPENPAGAPSEIFIPAPALAGAMDGDRVIAELAPELDRHRERGARGPRPAVRPAPRAPGRVVGRIVEVVSRQRTAVVGRLKKNPFYWYLMPDNPRLQHNVRVSGFAPAIKPLEDHKVVVRLAPARPGTAQLAGEVIEDLGRYDAPGVDVVGIIRDHEFATDFTLAARSQASRTSPPPAARLEPERRDLRRLVTFTMDPDDAKDYDDALSLVALPGGQWQLGVHIADVAYYVTPDSPIDREARARGNSVYLVDRAISMLPPNLTADVCSLLPDQDRLTHSVLLTLDARFRVLRAETMRAIIHSAARLTYTQAQAFFEKREAAARPIPAPVRAALTQLEPLARAMRKQRLAAGALDLAAPEVKCVLDARGRVSEIRQRGDDDAYQLVEECMLLANVAVAERLSGADVPALYRVHDAPEPEQWDLMRQELTSLGVTAVPDRPQDLNRIIHHAAGTPLQNTVSIAILRNLKRALYSAALRPHFGLAFPRYTHFTSPIRRYADLVVHRLLSALETGRPAPYSAADLAHLAAHCSATEREADEAENESVAIKRIAFYQEKIARGDVGPYRGVVVTLTGKGLIVELTDSLQRGLVPFATLPDDRYELNAERTKATGSRRRRAWSVGSIVQVRLARVDMPRRYLDFILAESSGKA